ncbi:MAG: Amidohydrolase 3 [Crocinitomicaceae bacterium]|jgi:predicted amidohydrolase YtcJ|nr:Amidohydrolase 3 [Crocinitomicaceae bacterium]
MKKLIFLFLGAFFLQACMKGQRVDLVVHNAKIHTVDENYNVHEAMAIKDGEIVEVGPERQILNKYAYDEEIDANGKDVYPGFTDAHGHILSLIDQRLNLDLSGSKSFGEVIFKLEKYASGQKRKFIVGRGWDQAVWGTKEFPDNEKINALFPDIPVLLIRVDGHAALINDCLYKKAKLEGKNIEGGKILLKNGKPTGIILDNTITEISKLIPPFTNQERQKAFLEIQEELFQYGITSVHEAGIEFKDIAFFQSMNKSKQLKLQLNAMLYPSKENIDFAQKNGVYHENNLLIRSFKVVGDGSLGSRGACLKHPYHDDPLTHGFLTTPVTEMRKVADVCRKTGYQMNTHAIGDSTNKVVIDLIAEMYAFKKDHRWRIEHAQVLDPADIKKMGDYAVFPSVQPTHAVSDQRWAEDRLGKERLKGAYAYQSILNTTGIFALGTDFPVESFDPFATIHAAVKRKNKENFPSSGFLASEAVSLENCIRGMTIWPAFACFREKSTGSLEKGKEATFIILDYPLTVSGNFKENFAYMTYIKGKKVYSAE